MNEASRAGVLAYALLVYGCAHAPPPECGTDRAELAQMAEVNHRCVEGDSYACAEAVTRCAGGARGYCQTSAPPADDQVRTARCLARESETGTLCSEPDAVELIRKAPGLVQRSFEACAAGRPGACFQLGRVLEHHGERAAALAAYRHACDPRTPTPPCIRADALAAADAAPTEATPTPAANVASAPEAVAVDAEAGPRSDATVAHEAMNGAASCLSNGTRSHGCISVQWSIDREGNPTSVAITGIDDAPTSGCMRVRLLRARFEAGATTRVMTVPVNCAAR